MMEDTQPKAFVFVLMPFEENFRDVYEVGIKPACNDAGAYCERVDKQIFVENILERVYNQIAKADVIVAEMTGRNPNVFYEVGYAHALNKRVILLTKKTDDIPFDLKHYPHIVYGESIATLKTQLEMRVRWCIENPKEALSTADLDLQFVLNGVPLVDNPHVEIVDHDAFQDTWRSYAHLSFKISVHNPTHRMISGDSFDLALVLPFDEVTGKYTVRSITRQPRGPAVVSLGSPASMFPGSWESFSSAVDVGFESDTAAQPRKCFLRLFTEVGPKDYPFLLTIRDSEE